VETDFHAVTGRKSELKTSSKDSLSIPPIGERKLAAGLRENERGAHRKEGKPPSAEKGRQ
jgi:hypothetical protein